MTVKFNRKIGLLVYNPPTFSTAATVDPATGSKLQQNNNQQLQGNGLDLSEMGIKFEVTQSDSVTPNAARIRVYNLKPETMSRVSGEFQRVTLQAGYDYPGGYGVIFDGTIKQVLFGHESNVDSYVDILAADGDIAFNRAIINTTLAAGHSSQDQLNALSKAMGLPIGYQMDLPPTAASRGTVLYGLASAHMRDLAATHNASWSIQNGQIHFVSLTSYLPGEAVELDSTSGLIGFPEQTPSGINVTCLIDPRIRIGGLIHIAAEDINQAPVVDAGPMLTGPGRLEKLPGFIAKISGSGFYKVVVHEFSGDTRGNEWDSRIVGLAVNVSAPRATSVNPWYAGAGIPGGSP